jgi:hypothetical protein
MYISGNGEVYDDDEIFSTVNKINIDETIDDYKFQDFDELIMSWEMRLCRF